jgi:nucleoside 2-deoxyribosyltransferase
MQVGNCPICNSIFCQFSEVPDRSSIIWKIRCPRCGEYSMDDNAMRYVIEALKLNKFDITTFLSMGDTSEQRTILFIEFAKKAADETRMDIPRSIISHVLRKRVDKTKPLTCDIIIGILRNNSVATPAEQANNFITYLGEHLSGPGDVYRAYAEQSRHGNIYGLLGLKTGLDEGQWKDFQFIITGLDEKKILNVEYEQSTSGGRKIPLYVSLTLDGWQKYEELKRSVKNSRRAFVAMEFSRPERTEVNYFFQNTLLDEYLVPAVKKTGYDLANALRSEPMAGNIHARLEVEIRAARFVVAELSHHNNGAYWEAGFARGLGKPVIYMYNEAIGEAPNPPHFDVRSDHYIAWEEDKPKEAADALKAVIRATLFGEAVMED